MSKAVTVSELPACQFCGQPAEYDARTKTGPGSIASMRWAYMCKSCWKLRTHQELGTGLGQKLILKDKEDCNGKNDKI